MAIKFITGNAGKFVEAKSILPQLEQVEFDLLEIQSLDPKEIIEEKLREAQKINQGEFIVEDTSLYITSLNGLPGPLVKWFLKSVGNEGIYSLASRLDNMSAQAKTVIGYSNGSGDVQYFEGVSDGIIVAPRGPNNFGWDQIFQPIGSEKTFAEMSPDEKNIVSMRRMAFEKLKEHLNK